MLLVGVQLTFQSSNFYYADKSCGGYNGKVCTSWIRTYAQPNCIVELFKLRLISEVPLPILMCYKCGKHIESNVR